MPTRKDKNTPGSELQATTLILHRATRHQIPGFMPACTLILLLTTTLAAAQEKFDPPKWIDAMKKIHTGFTGTQGYVAQFGDSITYSMPSGNP